MGLSASQARLLTITSRKSDCEFQSMRYSHQKLALSRSMTDISNEYQNSLNKTKLVYDFYGNGDQTNPVTYSLLMTPSELNGYMPMLTTASDGRVVLSSAYAAAARAAGIPQEGLGCLPSSEMRNKFYEGMVSAGIITDTMSKLCQGVSYSQNIGLGATTQVAQTIETKTVADFLDTLDDSVTLEFNSITGPIGKEDGAKIGNYKLEDLSNSGGNATSPSLSDLWNGNYVLYTVNNCATDHDADLSGLYGMNELVNWSGWQTMFNAIDNALDQTDPMVELAIDYARAEINNVIYGIGGTPEKPRFESTYGNGSGRDVGQFNEGTVVRNANSTDLGEEITVTDVDDGNGGTKDKTYSNGLEGLVNGFGGWDEVNLRGDAGNPTTELAKASYDEVIAGLKDGSENVIGYYGYRVNMQMGSYYKGDKNRTIGSGVAINVSNILKTYMTLIYSKLSTQNSRYKIDDHSYKITGLKDFSGTGSTRDTVFVSNGQQRSVNRSTFISDNCTFDMVIDTGLNTDGALFSGFYDALFNQLASRGWTENDNIRDREYLQQMYQNGMMYLTTCSDDGFYYQGDYSVNSYVREVTDDDAIAQAEAKYNTEKQKLNHKEEIIDLKMKNLDTEISALTTEYDTVKSLISKNIERGFKRYDA